jgi:hypothetical protein
MSVDRFITKALILAATVGCYSASAPFDAESDQSIDGLAIDGALTLTVAASGVNIPRDISLVIVQDVIGGVRRTATLVVGEPTTVQVPPGVYAIGVKSDHCIVTPAADVSATGNKWTIVGQNSKTRMTIPITCT